ncbi:MAG: hypothetical protein VW810_00460 [Pelagibacteraceae bacterium]
MILFKGKNKDCNIFKSLEKNFGVMFHPKLTVKEAHGFNNSKGSKPKQQIFQDSNTRTNLETEVGKIKS